MLAERRTHNGSPRGQGREVVPTLIRLVCVGDALDPGLVDIAQLVAHIFAAAVTDRAVSLRKSAITSQTLETDLALARRSRR
jgi:hypothetical protein